MSDGASNEWLFSGRGTPPTLRWSFDADGPIVGFHLARETGEVIIADQCGGLCFLNRKGELQSLVQTQRMIHAVTWADDGSSGVVAFVDGTIAWVDRRLRFRWTREMADDVLAIAIDSHGGFVLVTQADGINSVITIENKKLSKFETDRPLKFAQLLTMSPEFIASADHGLMVRYTIRGSEVWTQKLWTNIGDLATSGDGRHIFLAGFAHGALNYSGKDGTSKGTLVTPGTLGAISCGISGKRVIAATLERQMYTIDDDGQLMWSLTAPDDVARLQMSPLGDWSVCGFASGRIVRLDNEN